MQYEGKILLEVTQGDVAERVARRGLHLLAGVIEGCEDGGFQVGHLAQVGGPAGLPDCEEREGGGVVLLAAV